MTKLTPAQELKLEKAAGRKLTQGDLARLENTMEGLQDLIAVCGDDPSRDGLLESPFRVVKAYLEYTNGNIESPEEHLTKSFDVTHDDIVLIKDIPFNSLCEHHFAPFFGKVHIAYIPGEHITGLSKFGRLVDGYAKRFQVQERLTQEIADAITSTISPQAVAVIVEGTHYCMCGRGVKKAGATTTTSTMRGLFRESASARAEVLSLIK